MTEYKKYLVESNNIAANTAELAIERMEDTLADFEMFLDEKLQQLETTGDMSPDNISTTRSSIKNIKGLKSRFYKSFAKQWGSMKKDLITISKQIDSM